MKIDYRFLTQKDFSGLYRISQEAFSDYLVPVNLTELKFENHLAQNAVDLTRSVGALFEDKLIGYTLNGFGLWNGKTTAYDAGTGVIPGFRNRGVGRAMFDFLLPRLRNEGVEQMLLEVIEGNTNAIALYRKIGFGTVRKLLFFEAKGPLDLKSQNTFQIREIEHADWNFLRTFWDGTTSWQFSPESVERKLLPKIVFGAFSEGNCVGYGILNQSSGVVSQISVDKRLRRKGVGSALLAEMQMRTESGKPLRFSNVDDRLTGTIKFFRQLGFIETISQFEMIKNI